MRMTDGSAAMTGKRVLGIAAAGGAAVFMLASGGIAMASPLHGHGHRHGHGPAPAVTAGPGWNLVSNAPAPASAGAGNGKRGHVHGSKSTPAAGGPWSRVTNSQPACTSTRTSTTVQGRPGWNRVSNTPVTTGGEGGQAPGSVRTGGEGGQAPAF